jgi:D-glycero-D-manno-heptose 1,7-bisphosphate phosphatase
LRRAVFLDRDGVINALVPLPDDPRNSPRNVDEFELLPGAAEAIKLLKEAGWLVIVVSNQPTVAKGKSTFADIEAITNKMRDSLSGKGAYVDDVYYCLHHPDPKQVVRKSLLKECNCRKPKPGLLLQAAKDWDLDLYQSWMIGDSKTDIQAGQAAGCKTLLVTGGLKSEDIYRLC